MFEYMQLNIAPWGWEIPVYFFLIGTAGMVYVLATSPNVFGQSAAAMQSFQKPGLIMSLVLLLVSAPLLIVDLGQPGRFLYPILYFHWTSPLSWGALFLPLFGLSIVGFWFAMNKGDQKLMRLTGVLGSLLALSMPLYTGLDLMVNQARELWANPSIPVLFVVLSISSGAGVTALVLTAMGNMDAGATRLIRNVLFFSTAVSLALFLGLVTTLAYGSAEQQQALNIIGSEYGTQFWVITLVIGILVPLILVALPQFASNSAMVMASGVLAAIGAYAFRTVLVEAGQLPMLFY